MNDEIKKMWQLFPVGGDSILELRAFAPHKSPVVKHFRANQFQSTDELRAVFELAALGLNDGGYNIYTTLNPIKPSFNGNAATDKDIEYRDLLLIDLDRAAPAKQPATSKEVKAAKKLGEEIIAYLGALGWPKEPIQVMSGNGWHLYYELDELVNNNETTELIKQTLKLLAKHFNNSAVNIDTVVYNASRITKVPGTIMRKGDATEDRPHRMAVLHE
jgi:hypothetical protein